MVSSIKKKIFQKFLSFKESLDSAVDKFHTKKIDISNYLQARYADAGISERGKKMENRETMSERKEGKYQ